MSALKETKPENKEALNNIPDNINDAFQIYVQTSSRKLNNVAQQEIGRMIRWLGDRRAISGITPSEIGNYSDEFAKRTSVATVSQKVNYLKKFLLFLKLNELTDLNLASHLRMKKSNVGKITKKLEETKREEINLTEAGYKDLEKQLKELNDQRPRLAEEVRRAAADGDIRENAPLDAARENQDMVNSKIHELEGILKLATIIDESNTGDRIQIGSKVVIVNPVNENNYEYQLVEPNEANPLVGKISSVSPVGSAILGRRLGEEVLVKTPGGEQTFTINEIK